MSRRKKALPTVALGGVAFLVAWLGALHAIAQDTPVNPKADAPRAQAPTKTDETAMAPLSQADTEAPKEAQEAPPDVAEVKIEMQVDGDVITHLPLQDAPIRTVLRQLAMLGQKNILPSSKVKGTITADLFNVTFREALDGLLRVNGLAYVEEGDFIYVYTAKEMDEMAKNARTLETRVFRLSYMRPEDAADLIVPCLSADGKVAASPETEGGIETDKTDVGGMNHAAGDVLVVTDYPESLDQVAKLLDEADQQPQQVLIEATLMVARLTEDNSLGVNLQALDGVKLNQNTTSFSTGLGAGGLSFTWANKGDFAVLLDAVEGVTDVNILANPKLTVLNKQRGEIIVGFEDGYLDGTTMSDGGSTTQSVSFLETGTRLVVRPFIGDNGYVRMEVHPEDSSGDIDAAGLPYKSTTECTSNIIVKDGHTIVISGMFREITNKGASQVPLLGNIPVLGAAFGHNTDSVSREEMIILITPRIIKPAADAVVTDQLRDDMERFRMGMRENLQWFNRSRLASRYFNWAKEHVAKGHRRRALWDLNMALSLSPVMLEAIQYKEKLTGQAVWANEPRTSGVRWVVQSMVMNELEANVSEIIPPNRPMRPQMLPAAAKDALGIGYRYDGPIMPAVAPAPAAEATEAPAEPVAEAESVEDVVETAAVETTGAGEPVDLGEAADDLAAAEEASVDEAVADEAVADEAVADEAVADEPMMAAEAVDAEQPTVAAAPE